MAKDKEFEKQYKAEGRRRMKIRKENRKQRWTQRVKRYGRGAEVCPYCGEYMTWCSSCEMWSSTCCEDYGTCMCS